MDLDKYPEMMTVEQIAEVFNVGKAKVYLMLNNKEIDGVKMGKKLWRIPKNNVIEYAKSVGFIK